MIFTEKNWLGKEKTVFAITALLVIPAFLINLGMMTLIDDEGIRALVAKNMMTSGDYLSPRRFEALYFNKPPMWNWILIVSYSIFNQVSEFTTRLPTVFFAFLYGIAVYFLFKADLGKRSAALLALLTITCGRILIYDSMLGLIDICFSLVIFYMMIRMVHLARNEQWGRMYLVGYLLCALAFMLKTLPALAFLGISIMIIVFTYGNWKKLFHWSHFVSFFLFLGILGSYYIPYSMVNGSEVLLMRMMEESGKRTFVDSGVGETILNLFTFPLSFSYHFLPWSILTIFLFKKGVLQKIWENKFIRINILLLLANLLVYWLSPKIFARYLLMFPPFYYVGLLAAYRIHEQENTRLFSIFQKVWLALLAILAIAPFFSGLVPFAETINGLFGKSALLVVGLGAITYFAFREKSDRLPYFVLALVVLRIGFDVIILPSRLAEDPGSRVRTESLDLAKEIEGSQVILDTEKMFEPAIGFYLKSYEGTRLSQN
ncbi:MAG: phospholipid carrier-dependent glycosyltransferase, partial [Saprospiraceae bacterium]|nr:phospholipid carrier-dependent glycosyltransferase [Saprospiraceae bacterium]